MVFLFLNLSWIPTLNDIEITILELTSINKILSANTFRHIILNNHFDTKDPLSLI